MNNSIGKSSIAAYSEKEQQKAEYARNGIYTVMLKPLPIFKECILLAYYPTWRGFLIEYSDVYCLVHVTQKYVSLANYTGMYRGEAGCIGTTDER